MTCLSDEGTKKKSKWNIIRRHIVERLITLFRKFKKKKLSKRIILRNADFKMTLCRIFLHYQDCHKIDNFL